MLAYQIVAGFSEIKSQLRKQTNLSKSLEVLQLWFSFEEDVLYAHDFHDHKKCMALAVYKRNNSSWLVTFRGSAYGRQVIEYGINRSELNKLAYIFNDLYKSHGYI